MGKAKELAELANNLTVSGGAVTVSGFNYDNIVDSAPGALNTLNELAAAIGDDASFSTTVTNSIATKLPLAGGTLTGDIAHAGNLTLDVGGILNLDADTQIILKDGGANYGTFYASSSDFYIQSLAQDKDIVFYGNDNGTGIEAMRIDMSEGGKVGIGTASPQDLLHLNTLNSASHIRLQRFEQDQALVDGDEIGGIEFWANDGSYASNAPQLRAAIRAETQNTSSGTRLEFWTGNSSSAVAERMRIIADGNVGIGTTTPSVKLHVVGGGDANLYLKSDSSRSGAFLMKPGTDTVMGSLLQLADESYRLGTASNYHIQMNQDGKTILNATGNNVGIGTTNPDVKLDVGNSDSGSAGVVGIQIQNSQDFSTVYDGTNVATFAGIQTVNHDDTSNRTNTGVVFVHRSSSSGIAAIQSTSNSGDRADLRFITRGTGGISEKMRIDNNGKVGIGTDSPDKTLTVRGTSGDIVQAKIIYAGSDGNRSGLILQNTHTGGREYGLYVGNSSTGGGLGTGFGISDNTAGTAYRLFINSSGNVSIGTTDADKAQLSVYASADKPALLLSNADGGINPFAHRNSRYLTSNGTNWLVDGKDPIAVIAHNNTSTAKFASIGLALHQESDAVNTWSPPITFGNKSTSGNFNSIYGYIAGRKIGTGVDTNWNTGEVWIDTAGTKHNGNNAYMDNVPAIRVRTTGTVDMPWQAFSQGTFNGAVASNNTGFQMTVASSQGLNYNNHGTHGYGFTATEEGYYMCYATCLYYPGASGYVYFGWCLNGASKHHWHSNHSISSNHDFVSATLQYCNVGDHLSIENVSASIGGIWGGAHSQYYIWKVG